VSKLYDALRRMESERGRAASSSAPLAESLGDIIADTFELPESPSSMTNARPISRLVAFTDPKSLAAERFRALATRLENQRRQSEFKSLQITSAVVNEGKTLVAGNLAATLAKQSGSRVLLVEGDLHRPTLATLLGLGHLRGISHWWSATKENLGKYILRLDDTSLHFLSAGAVHDQPSQILRSGHFIEEWRKLASRFDWVIVDSTPMSPVVDAHLWSRLTDGMLLVVREGITPKKELKKGLASLDNPALIGIVFNEASDFDHPSYGQYYMPADSFNGGDQPRFIRSLQHLERARAWLKTEMRRSER
jgi:capsular exopolysaccharide synthesis family protein